MNPFEWEREPKRFLDTAKAVEASNDRKDFAGALKTVVSKGAAKPSR